MFSYTGLTPQQVYALQHKYHVYLLKSGRASISGCKGPPWNNLEFELTLSTVSQKNVAYVAQAFDHVIRDEN